MEWDGMGLDDLWCQNLAYKNKIFKSKKIVAVGGY